MKQKTYRFAGILLALWITVCALVPSFSPVRATETAWNLTEDTCIFWAQTGDSQFSDAELAEQIRLFDSELSAKLGIDVLPILYGDAEDAGPHDILLILDQSLDLPCEGYSIQVTGTQASISASDRDGLFYGCRNLIRQLLTSGSVSSISDAPDVAERAVSLDNGRKYFSVEWIKEFIREMSWANMNTLVLHFSEEMGVGIESKLYPWLAGRDGTLCAQAEITADNTVLTQEEIAQIVAYAGLYHIDIVPSFDSPGHMNYVVKKFNEKCADSSYSFTYNGKTYTAEAGSEIGNYFHYDGKTSIVQGSRNKNYSRGIDISNEVAVAFTRSLITEYAELFRSLGCTKFDIGGDELLGWGSAVVSTSKASRWQQLDHWKEYAIARTGNENAVAYDAFLLYMNDLYDLVTGLGYTSVRMWNDDALRSSDTGWKGVVQLNKNIDIWYWTPGTNPVSTYLNAGYEVYNILSAYNYYAMTENYFSSDRGSFASAYPNLIYTKWNPYVFDPNSSILGSGKNVELGNPGVLGSAFGVWCDNASLRTQEEVMEDLIPLIRAHAAKSWDAQCSSSVSYDQYCADWEKAGAAPAALPEAPQITPVKKLDLTAYNEAVTAFESVDRTQYTSESYAAYADAVQKAKALAASETCSQEALDSAVAEIHAKKRLLIPAETEEDSPVLALQSAAATAVNGRRVTLTAYCSREIANVQICNSRGEPVALTAFSCAEDPLSGIWIITIQFRKDLSGDQSFQFYTVEEDGTLSSAPLLFSVAE